MGLMTSNGFRSTRARVYGPGDVRPKSGNSGSPCRALPCMWSSLVNMVITRIDRSTSQLTSTRSIWVMTAQRCLVLLVHSSHMRLPHAGTFISDKISLGQEISHETLLSQAELSISDC